MTFRDPEAARRACADPTPVIDGRRKNGKTLELRWGRTERELIGKRWEVG